MKKVKALVAFSNGAIAMEQYEVRELPTDMANDLIAAGICVEISGGGSGGGVLVVGATVDGGTVTLDKTWQEIHDAVSASIVVEEEPNSLMIFTVYGINQYSIYSATVVGATPQITKVQFETDSADGYPSATIG